MNQIVVSFLVILTLSCTRRNSLAVADGDNDNGCDSSYTTMFMDTILNVEKLTFHCVKQGLQSKVVIGLNEEDTLYLEKELSERIIWKQYYEDGSKDEEYISIKIGEQYKANYFKKYNSNGDVVDDKSNYLNLVNSSENLKFKIIGPNVDSLKVVSNLNAFPSIFELSKNNSKEHLPLLNGNFFELDKEFFLDGNSVVVIAYFSPDDKGGVIGRPYYLDNRLIKWHENHSMNIP